jgi:hypothetical protein
MNTLEPDSIPSPPCWTYAALPISAGVLVICVTSLIWSGYLSPWTVAEWGLLVALYRTRQLTHHLLILMGFIASVAVIVIDAMGIAAQSQFRR